MANDRIEVLKEIWGRINPPEPVEPTMYIPEERESTLEVADFGIDMELAAAADKGESIESFISLGAAGTPPLQESCSSWLDRFDNI